MPENCDPSLQHAFKAATTILGITEYLLASSQVMDLRQPIKGRRDTRIRVCLTAVGRIDDAIQSLGTAVADARAIPDSIMAAFLSATSGDHEILGSYGTSAIDTAIRLGIDLAEAIEVRLAVREVEWSERDEWKRLSDNQRRFVVATREVASQLERQPDAWEQLKRLEAHVRGEYLRASGGSEDPADDDIPKPEPLADEDGELFPASASVTEKPEVKPIKLKNWAIGHDGTAWRIFQWFGNKQKWCERGRIDEIPPDAAMLALEIAEHGGSISQKDAIRLFKTGRRQWPDSQIFSNVCKHARKRLAKAIKGGITRVAKHGVVKEDPIRWDRGYPGWRCQIQIGFAGRDDNKELQWQTKEQRDRDDFSGGCRPE